MTMLSPTRIRTEDLLWIPEERMFVTEDSSLPPAGRVWDDSADIGYTLISHRSGREVVVALWREEQRDGDIMYWDYKPADPREHLFTLRVYND